MIRGKAERDPIVLAEGSGATAGRGPGIDLSFLDPTLAGQYCEIRLDRNRAFLTTKVGRPVSIAGHLESQRVLWDRDIVAIGEEAWFQILLPAEGSEHGPPANQSGSRQT